MHHNGSGPHGFVYARRFIWIDYPEALPEADADVTPEPGVDPDERPAPVFRPNPDYLGFAVRVLNNPNGAEMRDERDAWQEAIRHPVGTQPYRVAVDAYLQIICGRVREWRAFAADDDGAVSSIPAPGEVPLAENPEQWRAFYAIPWDLALWVIGQVRIAHLLRDGPEASKDPKAAAAATETPDTTTSTPPGTTVTPIPASTIPATARPSS